MQRLHRPARAPVRIAATISAVSALVSGSTTTSASTSCASSAIASAPGASPRVFQLSTIDVAGRRRLERAAAESAGREHGDADRAERRAAAGRPRRRSGGALAGASATSANERRPRPPATATAMPAQRDELGDHRRALQAEQLGPEGEHQHDGEGEQHGGGEDAAEHGHQEPTQPSRAAQRRAHRRP